MDDLKVLLIGGAPGVGKTTLGRTLAIKLGRTSLSIDDLMTAAKTVTTPESHPGLHFMHPMNYIDYFTTSSVDKLIADSDRQHEATWPVVARVIRNHATWGSPIVIDGWALRPEWVTALEHENVKSYWLVADPSVLEEREAKNADFTAPSPDPGRMLTNVLARSLWYNELIEDQATRLQLPILRQNGTTSVDEFCDIVLNGGVG